MESIRHADFCVIVAEPTSFGLHDLGMVTELVRVLGKPSGLLLNRCTDSIASMEVLASGLELPLLGIIPFEPALARLLAEGGVASREEEAYRNIFTGVWERIREVAGR
jgi:MinD superfamily P-loop ATPase